MPLVYRQYVFCLFYLKIVLVLKILLFWLPLTHVSHFFCILFHKDSPQTGRIIRFAGFLSEGRRKERVGHV